MNRRAVIIALPSVLVAVTAAFAECSSFYVKVFLCYGQGADGQVKSPVQMYRRAIIALPSALVAVWRLLAKYSSFYDKGFLCDGQGADRQAVLYEDRSC